MTRTLFTGLAAVLLAGCADEPTTPPRGQTTPSRGQTTVTVITVVTPARSSTTVATVTPSVTPRASTTATNTATLPARPTPVVKPDKFFDCVVTDKKEFWFEVSAVTSGTTYRLYPSNVMVDKPESKIQLINFKQIKPGQKLRVTVYVDGGNYRCDSVQLWGVQFNGRTRPPDGKPLSD